MILVTTSARKIQHKTVTPHYHLMSRRKKNQFHESDVLKPKEQRPKAAIIPKMRSKFCEFPYNILSLITINLYLFIAIQL